MIPIYEFLKYAFINGTHDGVFISDYPAILQILEANLSDKFFLEYHELYVRLWTVDGYKQYKTYCDGCPKPQLIVSLGEQLKQAISEEDWARVLEIRDKIKDKYG